MKVRLNFPQRIRLIEVTPTMGDLFEVYLGKDLKKRLDFTKEEAKKHNIQIKENGYSWDSTESVDFEFNDEERELFEKHIPLTIRFKQSLPEPSVDIFLLEVAGLFSIDMAKLMKKIREDQAAKKKQDA